MCGAFCILVTNHKVLTKSLFCIFVVLERAAIAATALLYVTPFEELTVITVYVVLKTHAKA